MRHQVVTTQKEVPDDEVLLTEKDVRQRVPLHRATIYLWVREGKFPEPIWLTPTKRVWRLSDIKRWIAERQANPARPRVYHTLTKEERAAGHATRRRNTAAKRAEARS
jgi:predicted DNA-binding transcriptional regulator AlpA